MSNKIGLRKKTDFFSMAEVYLILVKKNAFNAVFLNKIGVNK